MRRIRKILGWTLLLLALPVAIFGSVLPANEYKEWGIGALDCDGPIGVYVFAVPALVVYGAGLAINALRWRKRANLVVAILCLLTCLFLITNLVRAAREDYSQQEECR